MKRPTRNRCMATIVLAIAAVLSLAVPALADAKRPMALMIMVDGMRADAVETGEMPNLKTIMDGTWASGYYTAWSIDGGVVDSTSLRKTIPSSGPNHASIVTGVTPQKHGVTSNDNTGSGNFATYPTWLKRVVDAKPGATAVFAYTWANDADMGPADGVTFLAGTDAGNATAMATRLASADAPDATMYFIDGPDAAGHATSFFPMSAEYKAALATADGYIGQCPTTAATGICTGRSFMDARPTPCRLRYRAAKSPLAASPEYRTTTMSRPQRSPISASLHRVLTRCDATSLPVSMRRAHSPTVSSHTFRSTPPQLPTRRQARPSPRPPADRSPSPAAASSVATATSPAAPATTSSSMVLTPPPSPMRAANASQSRSG